MNRRAITRFFLQHVTGHRLYWKRSNPHWRNWNTDDVAIAKDGGINIHFKSLHAIVDFIERQAGVE